MIPRNNGDGNEVGSKGGGISWPDWGAHGGDPTHGPTKWVAAYLCICVRSIFNLASPYYPFRDPFPPSPQQGPGTITRPFRPPPTVIPPYAITLIPPRLPTPTSSPLPTPTAPPLPTPTALPPPPPPAPSPSPSCSTTSYVFNFVQNSL